MNEREAILTRIREALTVDAPPPDTHDNCAPSVTGRESTKRISDCLPSVGDRFEEQLELFRANSAELKTDFRLLNSLEDMIIELKKIAASEGWTKIATHSTDLTVVCDSLGLPVLRTDDGYDANELETCDVGITCCDALVAQTGSILVSSRSAGGRALSVLPPCHIVLARREQLIPDLPAAIALLESRYAGHYPSFVSFITGPSRTGDIERILVLGAHGPKKIHVLCI